MLKTILKILGGLVAIIVLTAGGFAAYVAGTWPMKRPVHAVDFKVEASPERLARGKKLVSIRCANCHYDQKTGGLTGRILADQPKKFGTFFSHNITKDPKLGAGRYTDGELAYLLRTGIRRDGLFTGPMMLSPHLADEDLASIIAFLRSDDPWVAPQAVPPPEPKDKVALGKYLAHRVKSYFMNTAA